MSRRYFDLGAHLDDGVFCPERDHVPVSQSAVIRDPLWRKGQRQ